LENLPGSARLTISITLFDYSTTLGNSCGNDFLIGGQVAVIPQIAKLSVEDLLAVSSVQVRA